MSARRRFRWVAYAALALAAPATLAAQGGTAGAHALLDRGIARMGGDSALRALRSIRTDVLTQWLRTSFATQPFADGPSYERNVDLRDYTTRSWRNTRAFLAASANAAPLIDVVRDTIASRFSSPAAGAPGSWAPLSLAYVDERRELFAFAAERLLPALRADPAIRLLADTTINGQPHGRIAAVVDGWPTTVFLRRSDGLPTMVRFRADETNDQGLAPWGVSDVEFWYSGWSRVQGGLFLPRQRDVIRAGKPYKRMTALAMAINPPAPADSFAISDSVTAAYLATERRPMWLVPLDSAKIVREHFAPFPPFTGSAGAVRIGGTWILMETGQTPGSTDRLAAWLARTVPGATITAGFATVPSTSNGGVRWFASRRLALHVAPGAVGQVRTMLGGMTGATVITAPRWVRVGTDSLWVEPFSGPEFNGGLAVYSPALKWLYIAVAGSPVVQTEQVALVARLAARGLPVEFLGSSRALVTPVAPPAR